MSTCIDCEYCEANNGKGRCKESPPELSPTQTGTNGIWKVVTGTEKACGKFQAK